MSVSRAEAARAVLGRFVMPRTIRTERLQLGPLDMAFEPTFRAFFTTDAARFVGGGPGRERIAWRTFAAFAGQWFLYGFGQYAITNREGEFVGYTGLWFPENKPEIEVGWGIFPEHQGKGYATEAARAVRAIAIGQGIPSLVSYISPENPSSSAVAKRLGATFEGMIGLGEHQAEVWRHNVPTPGHLPEPADILLETNVMPLSIGTRRLSMEPVRAEHFEPYAAFEADAHEQRHMGGPVDRYVAWRQFVASLGQWALRGYGMYALECEGRYIGRVGLFHPSFWPERELGWMLLSDAQGQGYATEAAAAVRAVAVEQGLGRLVSFIAPENTASIAVARRLGAHHAGRVQLAVGEALKFEHPMVRAELGQAA